MKIITKPTEYLDLISSYKHSIIDSYGYKKILNDYYSPEKYLLFHDSSHFIPMVQKNNTITFFGGTQHNHYNSFNFNCINFNNIITKLNNMNLNFRLLSMTTDPYKLLSPQFKKFDVPLPVTWIYQDIQKYNEQNFLDQFTGKKKWYIKRTIKNKDNYSFQQLNFHDFINSFNNLIYSHNQYFRDRNKISVWEGKENLLLDILKYFYINENLYIGSIKKSKTVAVYILVYNKKEIIYYFGTSLDARDNEVSKILYLDMLKNAQVIAKKYNILNFDALPGGFSNKRRFLFSPMPLYGLVNDPNWVIRQDPELTLEEYQQLTGRHIS